MQGECQRMEYKEAQEFDKKAKIVFMVFLHY